MRLIDLFKDELAQTGNTHDRQTARRYWARAVIETLQERALTADPVPVRKARRGDDKVIVNRGPYWQHVPDDQLHELLDYIKPFFRRAGNRGQAL